MERRKIVDLILLRKRKRKKKKKKNNNKTSNKKKETKKKEKEKEDEEDKEEKKDYNIYNVHLRVRLGWMLLSLLTKFQKEWKIIFFATVLASESSQ